jgi:hypothetical protein
MADTNKWISDMPLRGQVYLGNRLVGMMIYDSDDSRIDMDR